MRGSAPDRGFVHEERDPFNGLRVVRPGTAKQFIFVSGNFDELSLAENSDGLGVSVHFRNEMF